MAERLSERPLSQRSGLVSSDPIAAEGALTTQPIEPEAPTAKPRVDLELARLRFKQGEEAEKTQREREREDLQMYAGDQWDKDVRAARAGLNTQNGMPPVPARPCLTFNKLRAPVNQVLSQERQADMGIEIVPADDFVGLTGPIDHTEIELREGLVRRIQRQSEAQDARTWAFARAVQCGRGYYGVNLRWVTAKSFDQDIYLERFYNQAAVMLDPAHEQPDGSDADWGFVGRDIPWDEYKAEFPNAKMSKATESEFRAAGNEAPGWFSSEGDLRMCRVVSYYFTTREAKELCLLDDGSAVWRDQVPEGVEPRHARQYVKKHVWVAKIDGVQVLEQPIELPGPYVPIVKVLGTELQPYDKERRVEGMVRQAVDAQRGYNYMVSRQVEVMALTPMPPLMLASGQESGFEEWYKQANVRNLPYLPYNQVDDSNRQAPPPFRPDANVPIEATAISVQMFDGLIKSTTEVPDPTLGNVDPTLKSGKAIKAVIEQSRQGTSNFLDNLRRSMEHEARIINAWLPTVYGRPGRLVSIMTGQNEAQPVLLGQPMILDTSGPKPIAQPAQQGEQGAKTYTLTKEGEWNVAIKISKSYDTRREQEAEQVGQIIAADPQLMTVFGDLYFKNQDGPGSQEMAERMKAILDPRVQKLLSDGGKPQIPPELQQQMEQMGMMVEQLSKELEAKTKVIETDSIKAQQQILIEQQKQQAENARLEKETEAKIYIEKMKLAADLLKTRATLEAKQTEAMIDAEVAQLDATVAAAGEAEERQAVSQESDKARAFQASEAERSRQADAERAEREAQRATDAD
jgi:hypothetical protein